MCAYCAGHCCGAPLRSNSARSGFRRERVAPLRRPSINQDEGSAEAAKSVSVERKTEKLLGQLPGYALSKLVF